MTDRVNDALQVQIDAHGVDLQNIADFVRELQVEGNKGRERVREYVDVKDNQNRGRVISMLAILVPMVLAGIGLLYAMIDNNTSAIIQNRTAVAQHAIESAYSHGKLDGQVQLLVDQYKQQVLIPPVPVVPAAVKAVELDTDSKVLLREFIKRVDERSNK